jgi:dihydrofolate synthase/folylpolyglutamate synthase
MLKDKDISQVVSIMSPYINEWHIVELEGARAAKINELKDAISSLDKSNNRNKEIIVHANFLEATLSLKTSCKPKDRVVAFGSFLVVSEVIKACGQVYG